MDTLTLDAPTIEVTVRDTSGEPAWGSPGPWRVCTRKVVIGANCPKCGAPRGERRGRNLCEDGDYYWVEQWDNPCGHVDHYAAVIAEAKELKRLRLDAYLRGLGQGGIVDFKIYHAVRWYEVRGQVTEINWDKREVYAINPDNPQDKGWVAFRWIVVPEKGD
ncbi:hypothetical protein [Micromonospora chalcea]|uniref:hypothetical protein n=1 Tax=Micromonospora chalcea TaxID=1874 RepID=UPI003D7034DE